MKCKKFPDTRQMRLQRFFAVECKVSEYNCQNFNALCFQEKGFSWVGLNNSREDTHPM